MDATVLNSCHDVQASLAAAADAGCQNPRPLHRPRLEIADILRQGEAAFRAEYGHTITIDQERVLRELPGCRRGMFGGHSCSCDQCGHTTYHLHSCNNRNCPKCQEQLRQSWYEKEMENILPVDYYHAVFTLPQPLADLAEDNLRIVCDLLFAAVGKAISQTAAQWTALAAEMGFTAVLHTWGELLNGHPHLHCLVPGGGLSLVDGRWVNMPPGFFLPQERLRQIFRDTYLKLLKKKYACGELVLRGPLAQLRSPEEFARWIEKLARIEWITYARPLSTRGSEPGGIERTVKYLARYANRIAIANSRLISCDGEEVEFSYKDYRQQDTRDDGQAPRKVMRLPIAEFIRRFLQHVLPGGARHIRHFGFLTNHKKNEDLPQIRRQLGMASNSSQQSDDSQKDQEKDPFDGDADNESVHRCPKCEQGRMVINQEWPRPTIAELLAIPWHKLHGQQPIERKMVQREMVFQE